MAQAATLNDLLVSRIGPAVAATELVPLKVATVPRIGSVAHPTLVAVAGWLVPELSATVVPLPSLSRHRPAGAFATVPVGDTTCEAGGLFVAGGWSNP